MYSNHKYLATINVVAEDSMKQAVEEAISAQPEGENLVRNARKHYDIVHFFVLCHSYFHVLISVGND